MKKLLSVLALGILLTSCSNVNNVSQDIQMLQTKYPTVYSVNDIDYICIDSIGTTYHICVVGDGQITSNIKVK